MKNMKMKLITLMMIVIMVFTGCASVNMDMVIKSDGSGITQIVMRIDKAAINTELKKMGMTDAMILEYWKTLEESYKEQGLNVRTSVVDGKEYMNLQQSEKVQKVSDFALSDNAYITTDTFYSEFDLSEEMNDLGDMGELGTIAGSVDMSKISFEVSVTLPNNIVKTNGTISDTDKKTVKFNTPL